jgi:monofunctional biosynthetic peptidoglycan transglycosylase
MQASFALLIALCAALIIDDARTRAEGEKVADSRVVLDFGDPKEADRWVIVNDGVMGGRSRSTMKVTAEGTGVFQGNVSLENYGGFASTRTKPADHGLAGYATLKLRVKGDGRTYQLRSRTDDNFDGVSYRFEFGTKKGEWVVREAPIRDFKPTFRGRVLPDRPPLDPSRIRQLGFLIADKKAGPFRLEVDWVKAYAAKQ